jgi:hypothetical protein
MAFPQEFIKFGKVTFTNCSVTLFSSSHNTRSIANVPAGKIVNAYWQGTNIVVELSDGWVYVYSDFGSYSSRYKK